MLRILSKHKLTHQNLFQPNLKKKLNLKRMSQFSTNKWLKNQYLKEANLYESQADLAAKAIDQAISGVDESLGYKDFAKAIATILKNEYGTHNFIPFMEVLHAELSIEESLNEMVDSFLEDLSQELKGKYPELKFIADSKKIEVIGSNQDKADFANDNQSKKWGNDFVTFDIDDDDRGYMVSITRVNTL